MRKRFACQQAMLLGCSVVDDEHRVFVELLNQLADLPADPDQDRISAALNDFIDAFEKHCRMEVAVFRDLGFPKTESPMSAITKIWSPS